MRLLCIENGIGASYRRNGTRAWLRNRSRFWYGAGANMYGEGEKKSKKSRPWTGVDVYGE